MIQKLIKSTIVSDDLAGQADFKSWVITIQWNNAKIIQIPAQRLYFCTT